MESIVKLSKRLQAVANLTHPWRRIADIGSDHAHLPIYLRSTEQIDFAVCGEVIEGPYEIARDHVQKSGFATDLQVRLADGLQAIQPEDRVECAVIAGMGGMLITEILERGVDQLRSLQALVLQPNQNVDVVRNWLAEHSWQINAEDLVYDEGHYYQLIAAVPVSQPLHYQPVELLMGPKMLGNVEAASDFEKYWQFQLQQKQLVLAHLQQATQPPAEKIEHVRAEIKLIKEGLDATNSSTNY
ncbi:tRNA (adenine(22)-N(1))-methyltransferase [Lapidilactobacillus mulanensis]|uniref:tRNA (Adenine(22)-N(1))-methyltransferase n=1 Tax=Lapidilactobacillus mulanensis TaxID=2485999 RepID=A0ABW4DSP7_9LACO|nr:class I SAM-dependent methyltransferase [Lapidilactobacillus mulanensis]